MIDPTSSEQEARRFQTYSRQSHAMHVQAGKGMSAPNPAALGMPGDQEPISCQTNSDPKGTTG